MEVEAKEVPTLIDLDCHHGVLLRGLRLHILPPAFCQGVGRLAAEVFLVLCHLRSKGAINFSDASNDVLQEVGVEIIPVIAFL